MKEKIIKLIKSSNKADVVLAFYMMEHWDKYELLEFFSSFCMPSEGQYWLYKIKVPYVKGQRHYFLRTDCGLLLYHDVADGVGLMREGAYGKQFKSHNL